MCKTGHRTVSIPLHRFLEIDPSADPILFAARKIGARRQIPLLPRLIVEPNGLSGVGRNAGPGLQAPAQSIDAAQIALHRRALKIAVGLFRVFVLIERAKPHVGPVLTGQVLFPARPERAAAGRASSRHGICFAGKPTSTRHTTIVHHFPSSSHTLVLSSTITQNIPDSKNYTSHPHRSPKKDNKTTGLAPVVLSTRILRV